ncbi:S8 family serine peptidase [Halogeometricum limi]|uniref:Subtilase family protein n=1 Tax=Halogeometricum limi TaxID=555875 RepID=A0A1I6GRI1_9EURY|nr:S8 family serine peptidase [Halogeometricum limi]SFR44736.1 Subtilase family protein [Halogeometricum limi]
MYQKETDDPEEWRVSASEGAEISDVPPGGDSTPEELDELPDAEEFDAGKMGGADAPPHAEVDVETVDELPGGHLGEESGEIDGDGGKERVLVEVKLPLDVDADMAMAETSLASTGFELNPDYGVIPISASEDQLAADIDAGTEQIVVLCGEVDREKLDELKSRPNVLSVRKDSRIAPMSAPELEDRDDETAAASGAVASADAAESPELAVEAVPGQKLVEHDEAQVQPMSEDASSCPIGSCDCSPGTAKGTIQDVAAYLGVDAIHDEGITGQGIVVGVVDGGIRASGRVSGGAFDNVTDGYPSNWGQVAHWSGHGEMCATDVRGMAPDTELYDIRVAGSSGGYLSAMLAGIHWAITKHQQTGDPDILTFSNGIFQESWDADYARNPNHPVTRKVVEAIDEGILVTFAAGNCGATCPDGRCGSDNGPGRSIWGANGHPKVITVGAVNKDEQFVGYSSQGPAALSAEKPDICGITHFEGYFNSDSGTSAATPITAGVLALMKQANPAMDQDAAKAAMKQTAKDIGPSGHDQHSGSGILQAKAAYDAVKERWSRWERLYKPAFDVTATTRGTDGFDMFVTASNQHVYHRARKGGQWGSWTRVVGPVLKSSALSRSADSLDFFTITGNGTLYRRPWTESGGWGNWDRIVGPVYDAIAVPRGTDRFDLFIHYGNDHVYRRPWTASGGWGNWEAVYGPVQQMAVAARDDDTVDLMIEASNRRLYRRTLTTGGGWGNWEYVAGRAVEMSLASRAPDGLDLFVTMPNRSLYHRTWTQADGWGGLERVGGPVRKHLASSQGDGDLDLFTLGIDGSVYRRHLG